MKFLLLILIYISFGCLIVKSVRFRLGSRKHHRRRNSYTNQRNWILKFLQRNGLRKDMILKDPSDMLEKPVAPKKLKLLAKHDDVVLTNEEMSKIKTKMPSYKLDSRILKSGELDDIVQTAVNEVVQQISTAKHYPSKIRSNDYTNHSSNYGTTKSDIANVFNYLQEKNSTNNINEKENTSSLSRTRDFNASVTNFTRKNGSTYEKRNMFAETNSTLKAMDDTKITNNRTIPNLFTEDKKQSTKFIHTFVDTPKPKIRKDNFSFVDSLENRKINKNKYISPVVAKTGDRVNLTRYLNILSSLHSPRKDSEFDELRPEYFFFNRTNDEEEVDNEADQAQLRNNSTHHKEFPNISYFVFDPFSDIDSDAEDDVETNNTYTGYKKTVREKIYNSNNKTSNTFNKTNNNLKFSSFNRKEKWVPYRDIIGYYKRRKRFKTRTGTKKQNIITNSDKFEIEENRELSNLLTHLYNRDVDFAKNNVIRINDYNDKIESRKEDNQSNDESSSGNFAVHPQVKLLEAKDVIETDDKSFDEVRLDEPNLHLLATVDSLSTRNKIMSELSDVVKVLQQMKPPHHEYQATDNRGVRVARPTKSVSSTGATPFSLSTYTIKVGKDFYKLEKVSADKEYQGNKSQSLTQEKLHQSLNSGNIISSGASSYNTKVINEDENTYDVKQVTSAKSQSEETEIEQKIAEEAMKQSQLKRKLLAAETENKELERKNTEEQERKEQEEKQKYKAKQDEQQSKEEGKDKEKQQEGMKQKEVQQKQQKEEITSPRQIASPATDIITDSPNEQNATVMYPSLSLSKKADYQSEHNTTVKYPSESISNQTVIIKHNNEVYKVLQMDTDTDIKGDNITGAGDNTTTKPLRDEKLKKPFYVEHNNKIYKIQEVEFYKPCVISETFCKIEPDPMKNENNAEILKNQREVDKLNELDHPATPPVVEEETSDKKSQNTNSKTVKDVLILETPVSTNNELLFQDESQDKDTERIKKDSETEQVVKAIGRERLEQLKNESASQEKAVKNDTVVKADEHDADIEKVLNQPIEP